MKTKSFFLICLGVFSLLFGCKKQDITNENILKDTLEITKIKDWLSNQKCTQDAQNILIDGKVFKVSQIIQWEKTKYFSKSKTSITPVSYVSVTGNISGYKYLVTEEDENRKIKQCNYFVIAGNKNADMEITPDLFFLKNIPLNFNGTILKYDVNDNMVATTGFRNGLLINSTDKISVKKSKNQVPVNNNAPLDPGCVYVTVDWYWQTWVNGVLVSEEYLFSTTEIVCEGGNGGGGGSTPPTPPTPLEMCQAANAVILNDATFANTTISEAVESQSQLQRTKLYSWKCLKGLGWYVIAYDRGVHTRQSVTRPWKWVSLENTGISKVGNTTMYGGTVTATKVLSNATIGTYHATMHLVINIKSTTTYLNVTHSDERDFSSSKTWNSDDTGMNGY